MEAFSKCLKHHKAELDEFGRQVQRAVQNPRLMFATPNSSIRPRRLKYDSAGNSVQQPKQPRLDFASIKRTSQVARSADSAGSTQTANARSSAGAAPIGLTDFHSGTGNVSFRYQATTCTTTYTPPSSGSPAPASWKQQPQSSQERPVNGVSNSRNLDTSTSGSTAGLARFRNGSGYASFRNVNGVSSSQPKSTLSLEGWDQITQQMVALAGIPFMLLVVPQVLQNFNNIAAGHSASLSAISWLAYATGMCGNILMLTHFTMREEHNAAGIQILGIVSNFVVLSQVTAAGYVPGAAFSTVAAVAAAALAICAAKWMKAVSVRSLKEGLSVWRVWQLGSGLLGLALTPQILWSTISQNTSAILPAAITVVVLRFWLVGQMKGAADGGDSVADSLPGWAATCLFALAPLPQLARCFSAPDSLQGLSLGTMALALLGNALMVPRALLTKDRIWLAGAMWATVAAGWAQLLSMYLGRHPATGARFLSRDMLVGVTVVMAVYFAAISFIDSRIKGHGSPLRSFADAFSG